MSVTSATVKPAITGVILAGGRGSRMGGEDKGLVLFQNKPLYQHVLQRLAPQVTTVVINANRNFAAYQSSGLSVIADSMADFPGPLAGMLTALEHTQHEWLAFAACDTPHLPDDYVARLWLHHGNAPVVWVRNADRDHPTLALVHRSVLHSLQTYLIAGERRVLRFFQQCGGHSVCFNDPASCFTNINSPADLIDL